MGVRRSMLVLWSVVAAALSDSWTAYQEQPCCRPVTHHRVRHHRGESPHAFHCRCLNQNELLPFTLANYYSFLKTLTYKVTSAKRVNDFYIYYLIKITSLRVFISMICYYIPTVHYPNGYFEGT